MTSFLTIAGLTKRYGSRIVIDQVDLEVAQGELFTLLGPSGAGKSSILHAVAGLTSVEAGTISLAGRNLGSVPVDCRNVGVVFQNYSLFPNLTARENLCFPLEARRSRTWYGLLKNLFFHNGDVGEQQRVNEFLRLVQLTDHADRYPHQLSGGEQQRVALARAFVFDPDLLCLDEPLGALDKNLRQQLQTEIRLLQRRLNKTMLYVTHDQTEAFMVSDRIAIIHEGRIQQVGKGEELYCSPVNRFVASFLGECNVLPIERIEPDGMGVVITIPGGVTVQSTSENASSGAFVGIRPEQLRPCVEGSMPRNSLTGKVVSRLFLGSQLRFEIELPGGHQVNVLAAANQGHEFPAESHTIAVTYDPSAVLILS